MTKWVSWGIKWILVLFIDTTLKSFTHLQSEFSLPASEQFNYFRVASYFKGRNCIHYNLFWKIHIYLTTKESRRGGIQLFSNFLNYKSILEKKNSRLAWERYLDTSYTEEQWHKVLQHIHSATKCTNLWELSHMITQRWYLKPYRLAKFDPSTPPTCWRNCGQPGTIFDILWNCKNLTSYWSHIFKILCQTTDIQIRTSPSLAFLNICIEDISPQYRQFTTHLFLAAKLVILRKWRSLNPPEVEEVLSTLSLHFTYEKMLASIRGHYDNFLLHWHRWITWCDTHRK